MPSVARAYTWEELAASTLRRQFPPEVAGRGAASVVDLLRRVGPIQSQVARAPFLAVSSRLPGASYDDIVAAHESYDAVRGSSLRGTVHTSTADQHPLLDAITRRTLANLWRRSLKLRRVDAEAVRAAMERFATGEWRTPQELRAHLVSWLAEHDSAEAAEAAGTGGGGRAMAHLHSALIRRPLNGTGWERQSPPGYRVRTDVVGEPPSPWLDDPDRALVALTRVHLAAYGPANRRDIAWWSGERLGNVDSALAALGDEVESRPGPDGQLYYHLLEVSPGGSEDPGLRLLPEYDALVVAYDPKSRRRFLRDEHVPFLWQMANGSFSAAVLADARLRGSWKLSGSGARRRLEVRMFPGERLVDPGDFADQVAALEAALPLRIADVEVAAAD